MRKRRWDVAMGVAVACAALVGCGGAGTDAAVSVTRLPGQPAPTTASAPPTTAAPLSPVATIGFPPLGDRVGVTEPTSPPTTGRSSTGAYLGPLAFSWPAGCRVAVVETATRDDTAVELAYSIVTTADPEGLLLTFDAVTVRTIDGTPVPETAKDSLAAQFALPALVLDADGSVLSVRGAAETAARLRTAAPGAVDGLTDTEVAEAMSRTVTNIYWNSWITAWLPFSPIATERSQGTYELQLTSTTVQADVVVESLPVVETGAARLRQTTTLGSEALLRAVGAIAADADAAAVQQVLATSSGSRVNTIEITTDPSTMRPVDVSMRTEVTITQQGTTEKALELRRWSLDWRTAGC